MAKKNNTAEKALLNAEQISKALKESTEKTLKSIVNEAISDFIKDEDEPVDDEKLEKEEEPIEDDSFEVEDVETEKEPEEAEEDAPEEDAEAEDAAGDDAEGEDEWADMEDFKVGDNDYDFTGVDGETALKVYNKLGDDDQIFIKKEDDGTFTMEDEDTGAEYVIELSNEGDEDTDAAYADEEPEYEEPVDDEEVTFEVDLDDEEPEDDEDEEALNEDLGYTDNYQDKDPIDGLSMEDPADSKTTNDWDKGAPKSVKKPWAGKGDSDPFEKKVNECGVMPSGEQPIEEGDSIATQAARKEVKTKHKQHRPNTPEEVLKVDSPLNENVKKIISKAKEIQAENKQYKSKIAEIKKALYEAAILNINYGKVVSLLVNETTTKEEKASIVERFSNVKTINEGTQLYDTIKRELNETKKGAPIVERTINAESSKTINETTIYSPKDNASINLMERMENLYKGNKRH